MQLLYVAIYFLILTKYTYQSCGIITNLGDMSPIELDTEVGTDIVFNCTLREDSGYTSANIFFSHFNKDLSQNHVQIIDKYTAQLTIKNASANQSGRYFCKVNNVKENRKPLVCLSEAKVGYKPKDLPVTDFSCKYLYRQAMRCSWTKPHNKVDTHFTLSEYKHAIFHTVCPSMSEHFDRMTCVWNRITSNRATYQTQYFFELNQSNALGVHQQHYTYNLSSIVQLDSPPNFTFHKEISTLSWNYPNLIQNDNNLFHLLQFKVLVRTINQVYPTEYLLDYTKTSLKLDLKPYTRYNFSISAKVIDPKNEYWSEFTSIVERSKEDVPSAPPHAIAQAFETSNISPRSATIFWQPLAKNLINGPEVSYMVSYLEPETNVQININTTYTNLSFDSLSNRKYVFQIYSKNSVGLSKHSTSLVLPATNDILRPVSEIAVFVKPNGYAVEWERSSHAIQDYTVFYCIAKNDHCIGELKWKHVIHNTTTLDIPHDNYKFGISANTQHISSGIVWTHCIVNQKEKVDKLRNVFPIIKGSTSILIKWEFLCEAQKRLVRDLKIEYCPKDNCVNENKRFEVVDNLRSDHFQVSNLTPNTTYMFVLSSPTNAIVEESRVQGTTDIGVPASPFGLVIVSSSDNMSTIQWNFTTDMLDHFRVKFENDQAINKSKESCESQQYCFHSLTYTHPLKAYTNYSISVSSCNINYDCSNPTVVYLQTQPSRPGKMLIPMVEKLSASRYRVHFRPPIEANGPVDFYYVQQQNKEIKRYSAAERFADLNVDCEKTFQGENFKVHIAASNLVNGEELRGEYSDWASIDMCKASGMMLIVIVLIIVLCGIVATVVYCTISYMKTLKLKKKSFQINIQCNQTSDLNFGPYEKDNLVAPEEDDPKLVITERRKISNSVTNASMTSDSSMAENSHSSDKHDPSSSSDNCYNSDSTANYSDIHYRENHEYFLNNIDDSCRPLMGHHPFSATPMAGQIEDYNDDDDEVQATAAAAVSSTSKSLDMGKAIDLNKSPITYVPSSSQFIQKPVSNAVYVPLSPIPAATASTGANFNSNSHYVSHAFAASQNMKNSTNV